MSTDLNIRCDCGSFQAVASEITPDCGTHLTCYCDDCQAFQHFSALRHPLAPARRPQEIAVVRPRDGRPGQDAATPFQRRARTTEAAAKGIRRRPVRLKSRLHEQPLEDDVGHRWPPAVNPPSACSRCTSRWRSRAGPGTRCTAPSRRLRRPGTACSSGSSGSRRRPRRGSDISRNPRWPRRACSPMPARSDRRGSPARPPRTLVQRRLMRARPLARLSARTADGSARRAPAPKPAAIGPAPEAARHRSNR